MWDHLLFRLPLALLGFFTNLPFAVWRHVQVGLWGKPLKDKVVLVTGTTSGLGRALAEAFYDQGCILILAARREDRLTLVKHELIRKNNQPRGHILVPATQVLDLASGEEEVTAAARQALETFGKIDILVNNAGVSQRACAMDTDLATDRRIMEVNYFGMVALTKALLPSMVSRRSGHVVNISSLQGLIGIPERSAYAASKHAVQAFSDSLRAEVAEHNVAVTVVNPDYINTNLSYNALKGDGSKYEGMDKNTLFGANANDVAEKIVHGVVMEWPEMTPAWLPYRWLALYVRRLCPSLFFHIMEVRSWMGKKRKRPQQPVASCQSEEAGEDASSAALHENTAATSETTAQAALSLMPVRRAKPKRARRTLKSPGGIKLTPLAKMSKLAGLNKVTLSSRVSEAALALHEEATSEQPHEATSEPPHEATSEPPHEATSEPPHEATSEPVCKVATSEPTCEVVTAPKGTSEPVPKGTSEPVAKGTSEPACKETPSKPACEEVPSEPAYEEVPSEPACEEVPSEPACEEVPSEPACEEVPSEPACEEMSSVLVCEEMPSEPVREEMPSEPACKEPSHNETSETGHKEMPSEPVHEETPALLSDQECEDTLSELTQEETPSESEHEEIRAQLSEQECNDIPSEPAQEEQSSEPAHQEIPSEPAHEKTLSEPVCKETPETAHEEKRSKPGRKETLSESERKEMSSELGREETTQTVKETPSEQTGKETLSEQTSKETLSEPEQEENLSDPEGQDSSTGSMSEKPAREETPSPEPAMEAKEM